MLSIFLARPALLRVKYFNIHLNNELLFDRSRRAIFVVCSLLWICMIIFCVARFFFWVCVTDNDTPILSPHICTFIFFFGKRFDWKHRKKRPCRIGFVYCFTNISSQYIFPSHDGSKYEGQTVCMKCPYSLCCACEVAEQVHYSICVNSVLCKMAIVLFIYMEDTSRRLGSQCEYCVVRGNQV